MEKGINLVVVDSVASLVRKVSVSQSICSGHLIIICRNAGVRSRGSSGEARSPVSHRLSVEVCSGNVLDSCPSHQPGGALRVHHYLMHLLMLLPLLRERVLLHQSGVKCRFSERHQRVEEAAIPVQPLLWDQTLLRLLTLSG